MTVDQLWDRTWGPLSNRPQSDVDFITAINEATEQIFNYLWKRKSELVKQSFRVLYQVRSADGSTLLPDEFRGFAERPSIDGETNPLEPLTEYERSRVTSADGKPTHYELRGLTLRVWPSPESGTYIAGVWFIKPDDVTGYGDYLPFDSMLDMAYRSLILAIAEHGVDADFGGLLDRHVGELLSVRDYHSPPRTVIKDY